MGKIIDKGLIPPDDPIFSEPLRIFTMPFKKSKTNSPTSTAGDQKNQEAAEKPKGTERPPESET